MISVLKPEFVEFIPERLEDGTLYISRTYATAVHKCCCGCGHKVVTPLSATGWKLTVDGDCVTLYPSIGNWSFPCRSHYWIRRNSVQPSYDMTTDEIEIGRRHDAKIKQRYFAGDKTPAATISEHEEAEAGSKPSSFWQQLKAWLFG